MENKGWFVGLIIALVIGGILGAVFVPKENGVPTLEVIKQINDAVDEAVLGRDNQIVELQLEIETLKKEIEAKDEMGESVVPWSNVSGYLLDEFELGVPFNEVLSDREISYFIDGDVEFKDKDYDIEEILTLDGEVAINKVDFKGHAYLTIPKEGILYELNLESNLNTSEIDGEDTLPLNLLGNPIEIVEWSGNKITLIEGKEFYLKEGETIEVEGKELTLEAVSENAAYLIVGDVGKVIKEEKTREVDGLEVKVKSVFHTGVSGQNRATLIIGDEVESEIEDGDEVEDIWEFVITSNSIGVKLSEDFTKLDDRHGYNALDEGEVICLPNEYACVQYLGLSKEDSETYEFYLDDSVLVAEGNFVSGINDYDEVFIVNQTIYEDDDLETAITEVYLGDTGLELDVTSFIDLVVIDDIKLGINLTDIKVDSVSIATKKDDYLTTYGIVIENPEDAIEDNEVKLVVPEEKLNCLVVI